MRQLLSKSDPRELEKTLIDEKTLIQFLFELIGIAYATSSTVFARNLTVTIRLTHDTLAIASEAIMLLRHLMKSSSAWKDYIVWILRDSLRRIPSLVDREKLRRSTIPDQEYIWDCMAAICIIGGDIDCLRLGARVMSESRIEGNSVYEPGTIVDFDILANRAKVVLDQQTPIQPVDKELNLLTAISEVRFLSLLVVMVTKNFL